MVPGIQLGWISFNIAQSTNRLNVNFWIYSLDLSIMEKIALNTIY